MVFYFFFVILLIMLLLLVVYLLTFSYVFDNPSYFSPFECGFQSFSNLGVSFSVPFFMISLMFLLFDVEILLVCFYPLFFSSWGFLSFSFFFLLLMILLATFYEWFCGVLCWV